jgi:TonB-dependent starch-binding outer membrane protein SusC
MNKFIQMKTKLYLLFCLLVPLGIGHAAWAQSRTITGRVTSEGEGLPGVNVLLKGSSTGTTTNTEGAYSLNIPDGNGTLVFSYIGYTTEEVAINNRPVIDVSLMPDIKSLSEVVVVGYGSVKKSDLTGSVASIKSTEINAFPATNLMQSMAGRATGVQISQNTGAPGSAISVRIRGTNSIQGSNEPLYVVDGFPFTGSPTLLNNADIESIEVLKDASATAIYGSRGANGVVLITTRRGKAGKTTVEYDGYHGIQTARNTLDLMNPREYMLFQNEIAANDKLNPRFTQDEIDNAGEGTDWQNEVLRSAPISNHALSINGGSEKMQFSIGLSRFDQQGIIIGSDYNRTSARAAVNADISKKLSFSFNATASRIDSDRQNSGGGNRGGSLISAMISGYPTFSPYNDDGTYRNMATAYNWGSNVIQNPVAIVHEVSDHLRSNAILTNASFTFRPLEGLSIKILGGVDNTDDRVDFYNTRQNINSQGTASIATDQRTSLLNENTINYTKEFGSHSLSVLGGFTYQDFTGTGLNASGSGFVSDNQESFDIGSAATLGVPSSSYSRWTLLSYLGRINYSWKSKILATVSFRADGSSRYSADSKWGYFPSGALAYRLSEEPFMQSLPAISDLKVRAGYGTSGSTAINPYQTLTLLDATKVVFGDALFTAYAPGSRLPGNLRWETTEQVDFGVDLGLFKNRLQFTADYYIKNTRDLLNNVQLPSSLGYLTTIQNVGKIQNRGLELSATANALTGAFKWDVSANISFNRNKVVKLYDGKDVLGDPINITVVNDNINILREGQPLGVFYGYVEEGYDENGKIRYKDFNGNNIRDLADKQIIGDPNPDFIYGFNSTMSFKNFEFIVFIQGSQGNDIFNLSSVNQTLDYGFGLNMPREIFYNHWTPETPNAKYPFPSRTTQTQVSDRFVEDGSFLRFRNIQLGYNLPVSALHVNWISRAQLYVSAQNYITFTKYSWFDPEINSYGGGNSIRQGIDHYSYPTAKSITLGVRLGF